MENFGRMLQKFLRARLNFNSRITILFHNANALFSKPLEQCHLVKKPSHIFRQAQYDQRAVSQSLSKTVGGYFSLTKRH